MPFPRHMIRATAASAADTRPFDYRPKPPKERPRPVKVTVKKGGMCVVCGKKCWRTLVFEERFTPLNKNPDGSIRTVQEIQDRLKREASAWRPDFTHDHCKEK
jgi:hypothetical protein